MPNETLPIPVWQEDVPKVDPAMPIVGWIHRVALSIVRSGAPVNIYPTQGRSSYSYQLVILKDAQAALAIKDAEIAILKTDLRALQAFTAEVFGDFPEHGDMDGIDLQIAAEACGLLKRENIAAPCGENCACAQCGVDGLTDCYRVQPVFMRARMAIADLDSLRAIVEQDKKGNRT